MTQEKDLGRSRGIEDCACDLSAWRHGIMEVPEWCPVHRLLFKLFKSQSRYTAYIR